MNVLFIFEFPFFFYFGISLKIGSFSFTLLNKFFRGFLSLFSISSRDFFYFCISFNRGNCLAVDRVLPARRQMALCLAVS